MVILNSEFNKAIILLIPQLITLSTFIFAYVLAVDVNNIMFGYDCYDTFITIILLSY